MLLDDKVILITGVLNRRSIAYGVAQAVHRYGGRLILTHQAGEQFESRLRKIAKDDFEKALVAQCDLTDDSDIERTMEAVSGRHGQLNGIVHSVAYAPRETLQGKYHESVSREAFSMANDISSYSLAALVKAGIPLMKGTGGSVVAMSYIGASRTIPNYNLMGVAKASLEANARYLAFSAGTDNIRVNVLSPGPVKTLAASAIGDIGLMLDVVKRQAPLGRNITTKDIGNAAAFLLSDMSSAITGETIHVDGGFHTTMMTPPGEENNRSTPG